MQYNVCYAIDRLIKSFIIRLIITRQYSPIKVPLFDIFQHYIHYIVQSSVNACFLSDRADLMFTMMRRNIKLFITCIYSPLRHWFNTVIVILILHDKNAVWFKWLHAPFICCWLDLQKRLAYGKDIQLYVMQIRILKLSSHIKHTPFVVKNTRFVW